MKVAPSLFQVAPNGRTRKPRRSITIEAILDSATKLTDEGGLTSLSMPKLADSLGCGAMTLYGHVDSKEDLLDKLSCAILQALELDTTAPVAWREALSNYCYAIRSLAHKHRVLPELLISRRMWSPRLADVLEWLLGNLTAGGWSIEAAIRVYRAAQTYTLGFCAYETQRLSPEHVSDYSVWWRREIAALTPEDYKHLISAAPYLPLGAQDEQFKWGLNALIRGLDATRLST